MNLYRVFKELKNREEYWQRHKLLLKLQGKNWYTESELNDVLDYLKQEPQTNRYAEDLTKKAIFTSSLSEKLRILKKLSGFQLSQSITLLMFHNPRKYAELNRNSWNRLIKFHGFNSIEKDKKAEYNLEEYKSYLAALNELSLEFGMSIADIEYTLNNADL